jgi:hypothetical protein
VSIIIPLRSDLPYFDLEVELDGVTYGLELRWNTRAEGWFLTIFNPETEEVIRAGIRVVCDFPLRSYEADRLPPGALVAVDTSGEATDPGYGDLGDRVQLLYFTAAELGL